MISRRELLRLSASLGIVPAANQRALVQPKRRIFGEVLDKNNKPIDTVLVTAYRLKVKIGETKTADGGKYSLEFSGDTPIDTVRYQQTAYLDGLVEDLCGTRDQNISKTLYLKGTQLNLFEAQEVLSAIERVFYIEEGTQFFKVSYPQYVDALGKLRDAIPTRLNARLDAVATLYRGSV